MNPVIVLTGPTGSGKSSIIYNLPKSLPIEIINADSRQIYRYMQIGTAIPEDEQLKIFKHHLFAFLDPSETYSAGQYIQNCKPIIDEILKRNHIPVIVGGTFFYIRALWDGLIENVKIAPEIQTKIGNLSQVEAYDLLKRLDPERALKLYPSDEHRVKRSLMLISGTENQISRLPKTGGIYSNYDFQSFYVDLDRTLLYDRINARVKTMFEKGLLNEVKKLIDMNYTIQDPGLNAIGYKEILQINTEYSLELGSWPEQFTNMAIDKISQATRNFAKRQLTWFRNENRLKRIDPSQAVSLLSELILQYTQKK